MVLPIRHIGKMEVRMKRKNLWIAAFLIPSLMMFLFVYAVPLVMMIYKSFTNATLASGETFVGFKNYIYLFTHDDDYLAALKNTALWVVLYAFVHIPFGTLVALVLAKKVVGWKFARTVYMIPNIISGIAMGMMLLYIFNPEFGAVNNLIRVFGLKDYSHNWFFDTSTAFITVTVSNIFYAAVVTILVLAEIASIPSSIFESAKVDGASALQTDLYITLPMLKNIIGTCFILATTSVLTSFDMIYITTKGGPGNATMNLSYYLYNTINLTNKVGLGNAIGVTQLIFGFMLVILVTRVLKIGKSEHI
jgi:raffinose/stachyose/melibiose transport system permease protein